MQNPSLDGRTQKLHLLRIINARIPFNLCAAVPGTCAGTDVHFQDTFHRVSNTRGDRHRCLDPDLQARRGLPVGNCPFSIFHFALSTWVIGIGDPGSWRAGAVWVGEGYGS